MGLLQEVRDEAARRGYSRRTASAYASWVRRFVLHHGRRHPRELGTEEVRAFLVFQAVERSVSSATRNQALAALRFLYRNVLCDVPEGLDELERAKRDIVLPVVLSQHGALPLTDIRRARRHGSTHPIPRCVPTHLRHGAVTALPPGLRSVDQRLRSAL